jgi:predicted lipid-binding transport protein (Tim44 family)
MAVEHFAEIFFAPGDFTLDEKSGQVLAGDPQSPIEFTESWTFSRNIGERNWVLAGISQNWVQ